MPARAFLNNRKSKILPGEPAFYFRSFSNLQTFSFFCLYNLILTPSLFLRVRVGILQLLYRMHRTKE